MLNWGHLAVRRYRGTATSEIQRFRSAPWQWKMFFSVEITVFSHLLNLLSSPIRRSRAKTDSIHTVQQNSLLWKGCHCTPAQLRRPAAAITEGGMRSSAAVGSHCIRNVRSTNRPHVGPPVRPSNRSTQRRTTSRATHWQRIHARYRRRPRRLYCNVASNDGTLARLLLSFDSPDSI